MADREFVQMGKTGLTLIGRTAVIVGGTSGIGRAIAHGLADAGADVVPHLVAKVRLMLPPANWNRRAAIPCVLPPM